MNASEKPSHALVPRQEKLPSLYQRQDSLALYLQELKKYHLLTKEEEYELAQKWFLEKDPEAKKNLAKGNLRLVVKIAMEYRYPYVSLLDLIQEGNAGLLVAIERFDPNRGVKLSTYSAWWIKAFILKFLMDNKSLVRMGTTDAQRKLFFRLRSEAERIYAFQQKYDTKLLAENIGVKESEVVEMQQRLQGGDLSLDQDQSQKEDAQGLSNLLQILKSKEIDPKDAFEKKQLLQKLKKTLKTLTPQLSEREKRLIQERILSEEPLTLQNFGEKYGISRERVRQIESKLLQKIRHTFHQINPSLPLKTQRIRKHHLPHTSR